MKHLAQRSILIGSAASLILIFIVTGAYAQDERIAAAKKERPLRIYSVMPATYNESIFKAFTQRVPFAQASYYRAASDVLLTRILTEARAGKHNFDVVFIDDFETLEIKRHRLLLEYNSPEAQGYRAADRDPEGFWTDFTNIYIVIAYNHQLVPKERVPRDWENLLDPYWKSKIGLDESEVEWFGSLIHYWGREKGRKFMEALKAQHPQMRRGHTLLAQINAAGEIPLSVNYAGSVEALSKKGAPLAWVRTTRPIVYRRTILSIARNTVSPNLAKLFVDFCLSPEGQREVMKAGSEPARPGVSTNTAELDLRPIPQEVIQDLNRYREEFRQLFER